MVQALAKFSTYPSACLNFVDLSLDQRRRSSSRHNMGLIGEWLIILVITNTVLSLLLYLFAVFAIRLFMRMCLDNGK